MIERYANCIEKIIGEPVQFSYLRIKGYLPLTLDQLPYVKGKIAPTIIQIRPAKDPLTTLIATFSLTEMPGCCGVLISFHSEVSSKFRNKGIGTILNQLRIEIAELLGYTVLMCTDKATNINQSKILKKNGWKSIVIWGCELKSLRIDETLNNLLEKLL